MKTTSPRKSLSLFLSLSFALVLTTLTYAQTTYTVDNRPESGAQFTSVQAAHDAAVAGDIIYIHPSPTSYGNVTISKTITLVGPGHNPQNSDGVRASLNYIYLGANSSDSVIKGLYFDRLIGNASTNNIHIANNLITQYIYSYASVGSSGWIIEGNAFVGYWGSTCISGDGLQNAQIRNNYIQGQLSYLDHTNIITNNLFVHGDTSGSALIFINSNGITSPIVANNMFLFTDPDITELTSSGTPITYTNCLTWKAAGGADLIPLPGFGNIDNTNPLFSDIPTSLTDFYNNDYTLQVSSPAIGTATDEGDIGVFGRNYPFDVNGRPNSMSYIESMTILNTVVQPGQALQVELKAAQKN